VRWLDRSMPDIDEAKEALKRIAANGHRAGAVIGSIRAMFKSDARNRASLDINELINEAINMLRSDLQKHRISVQTDQGNRIWNVLDISAACCGVKENRFYPHGVEARGWGMGWRHLRRVLKVLKIHGLVTPGGTICLKF